MNTLALIAVALLGVAQTEPPVAPPAPTVEDRLRDVRESIKDSFEDAKKRITGPEVLDTTLTLVFTLSRDDKAVVGPMSIATATSSYQLNGTGTEVSSSLFGADSRRTATLEVRGTARREGARYLLTFEGQFDISIEGGDSANAEFDASALLAPGDRSTVVESGGYVLSIAITSNEEEKQVV